MASSGCTFGGKEGGTWRSNNSRATGVNPCLPKYKVTCRGTPWTVGGKVGGALAMASSNLALPPGVTRIGWIPSSDVVAS